MSDEYLSSNLSVAAQLARSHTVVQVYGRDGSPWEFNLRDIFRWCELLKREVGGL